MSVSCIVCPDCGFELFYANLGSKSSYRTGHDFRRICPRGADFEELDAMNCPVVRAEAERVLKVRFPVRDNKP